MHHSTTQTVLFCHLLSKPVIAKFDQEHSSTDGGALLLKAVDEQLGLSQRLGACVGDPRQPAQGAPRDARSVAAADVRNRLWLPRRQRRGSTGGRPHPQASAGAGSDRGRALGLAAHALALREHGAPGGPLSPGERAGGDGDRAPPPEAARKGPAHHDRSGSDGRSHARSGHDHSWCYLPVVKLTFGEEAEQHVVAVVLRRQRGRSGGVDRAPAATVWEAANKRFRGQGCGCGWTEALRRPGSSSS
jgi:hypothetical protein